MDPMPRQDVKLPPTIGESAARRAAVLDIIRMVKRLAEYYETPEEVARYLSSPHPQFGGQIVADLIAAGRGDEVLLTLDAMDTGTFL